MPRISDSISIKAKKMSFLAMLAVVALHTYPFNGIANSNGAVLFTQNFLLRNLTCFPVSYFFMASGFFFAERFKDVPFKELFSIKSHNGYISLVQGKIKTLAVPYLLWGFVGTAILLPLLMLHNCLHGHEIFQGTVLGTHGLFNKIDMIFGIFAQYPATYGHLWFVKTLFAIFLIAPILSGLAKSSKWILPAIGILLLFALPQNNFKQVPVMIAPNNIGFFILGMAVAHLGLSQLKVNCILKFACFIGYAGIGIYRSWPSGVLGEQIVPHATIQIQRLCAIIFLWSICSEEPAKGNVRDSCLNMTFWVYCIHGCLLPWPSAIVAYLMEKSDMREIVTSLVAVLFTLFAGFGIGFFLKKRLPRVYSAMSGGR